MTLLRLVGNGYAGGLAMTLLRLVGSGYADGSVMALLRLSRQWERGRLGYGVVKIKSAMGTRAAWLWRC